ncbi:bifunctional hydroxymethylpyrimidine kinase/phosphomethylpyrimidine kinase [Amycolatopsis rubida]|uniref:Bifunctional hydroxymethylpyrimidine kinase/phosphomethylpyrimidine kinase n=1 Tax=Amycolatopsis rubida TaxID=112413 RepID=A0A1I5GNN9_9PSEU|nr:MULTISPECIES: bifunctional hydroxymethylpyrimidine kinase/phosphomethylpyrimidine kinase [Amycolatopsis]MYW89866.1 bifunctional hydroxymethylpyrimidine kinase/phosphomethylpyrimidine kinase [Amycolatopsis rubida]NEC54843.1 bifunctional hydroxymethylpyrimidine kinase/phosphomethylpyrimidine kinase [Amycolatopsis rubida]OAP26796.1 Hydroxymethylpyrimidine/phosphomethylpyrimidine kinase [Amycolatopsis sp. M39]SFO37572.1 hydroxymethylpyrimidine/phosphomethylpyrimidine kinase [Amycolatopsis rubida
MTENPSPPSALTIAGSDSGGAAGLQADLRTFLTCGVHGLVAVTAVTVQNTLGVHDRADLPPHIVAGQIEAVAADMGVGAAKTGMLASAEIIHAVAAACDKAGIGRDGAIPFVVDPVAAAMTGQSLFDDNGLAALRDDLLPRATVLTPNLDEVRLLTGMTVTDREGMHAAAVVLHQLGPKYVLVKSGHLQSDPECVDLLFDGSTFVELPGPRWRTPHTHGAGDTMASALTAGLAKGMPVVEAARYGKWFVSQAVEHSYPMGAKVGPVSAFWRLAPEER